MRHFSIDELVHVADTYTKALREYLDLIDCGDLEEECFGYNILTSINHNLNCLINSLNNYGGDSHQLFNDLCNSLGVPPFAVKDGFIKDGALYKLNVNGDEFMVRPAVDKDLLDLLKKLANYCREDCCED